MFLAIAAGIINIPVISNNPTILIEIAITAANKIVKKMGDKGKYDSQNQLKTLVVMQVLGNSKDFFSTQQNLPDIQGFFTDVTLPDSTLSTNNMAQYFLFGGSNSAHNALVDMQYK